MEEFDISDKQFQAFCHVYKERRDNDEAISAFQKNKKKRNEISKWDSSTAL